MGPRQSWLASMAVAGSLLVLSMSAVSAAESSSLDGVRPADVPVSAWGWVVDRSPGAAHVVPAAKDHGSSAGGTSSVTRTGVGRYTVRMAGIAAPDGTAHVSALGTAGRICRVDEWYGAAGDELVLVSCFRRTGGAADSPFIANWYRASGAVGSPGQAYLWANEPSSTDYTPDGSYSYSSMGAPNTIHRLGVGRYQATLGDMAFAGGNVQVTAYGTKSTCRVPGWDPSSGDEMVWVTCRTLGGARVDTPFTLSFTNDNGLKGFDRTIAYAWASQPTRARYRPEAMYRYSDPGVTFRIDRTRRGVYVVTMRSAPLGGSVQVTPYGSGKSRCNVASIRKTGAPQQVGVRCYGTGGALVDSMFSFSYAK